MRILVYAVLCFALCTATLVAQPAAVTVISGNGQMTCLICLHASLTGFDPMVVQVTDAKGNPVISTPVVWTVAGGSAYFISSGANTVTTNTDNNGYASAQIAQTAAIESGPQFGLVSTVTASATGVTATLYESQGAPVENPGPGTIDVNVNYQNAPEYVTITGTAGSAGPSFTIGVYTDSGTGIPNVAMMLMNEDGSVGPSATIPSAYCQTQPGAGLYTVLSPSSGVATCNVIFGPVAGSGTYEIVTGGSISATAGNKPDSNFFSGALNMSVTPPTVGSVAVVSGNNQSGLAGSTLSALVAEVLDTNGNPLVGQGVTWSVSPVNTVQLNNITSVSDANGLVKVQTPVISSAAAGTLTVTATSNSNSKAAAVFTISASQPVTVSSIAIQEGNQQSAVEGAAFTTPLEVYVLGTNGAPLAGVTVSFTGSGPVVLSASSTTTSSSGLAEVTATAGNTAGSATVTASIGGLSQVFNLTVAAPGPHLTVNSFVNGADGQVGSISPCGIAAILGAGVSAGGSSMPPVVGPLQYEVANATVNFGTTQTPLWAPIFSVSNIAGQQQMLIQVPCEVTPGTVPVTVTVNGGSQTLNLNVLPASPGVFLTTMSDGVVRAVVEKEDGSFVSPSNPARRGENDTVFVTGLGSVSPQVVSNALPIAFTPSTVNGQVIVGIQNSGVPVVLSQLSNDMLGVYTVEFQVPTNAPQGNNIVFSVGLVPAGSTKAYYSAGTTIPIE